MASRITETEVNGNIVWVDANKTWRWLDAVGPDVVKWAQDFLVFPVDDTSGNPTAYTTTEVGTNTIALVAGADAGNVLITTGGTENNGLQIQLLGEAFKLVKGYPFYLGAKFKVSDADQIDAAVGLSITDTTILADGVTDGLYWRTDDTYAVMHLIVEKDSEETLAGAFTLTDDTFVTAEAHYDGDTLNIYYNGVLTGSLTDNDANWPDDEYLTPSIAILTGATAVSYLTAEWARAILIRQS